MTAPTSFPRQLILGHRGWPGSQPENTLRSFAAALEAGADGVELDVQRAKDGTPVVVHDQTLKRTMGVPRQVARLAWPAIERLTGARLPSLGQAAAWASASGAWLNVEIKTRNVEAAVLDVLTQAHVLERAIISSFDPTVVAEVGKLNDRVRRFLLTEEWNSDIATIARQVEAGGICLHRDAATAATLADMRGREMPVVVWTVNDPDSIGRFLHAGVAAIITDEPAVAVEVRARFTQG